MRPADSEKRFVDVINDLGFFKEALTARQTLDAIHVFYEKDRAVGCDFDEDGDMLLYQFGTYDFDGPPTFQWNLTRQFIPTESDDEDDGMSQLQVTLHYAATDELTALGSSNRWCHDLGEVPSFRKGVESSEAFKALADQKATRTEIVYDII